MLARRPSPFALLALLLALTLAACAASSRRQPFSVTAPWTDGEISRYDVLDAAGSAKGAASWSFARSGEGWHGSFELAVGSKRERGDVELDASVRPRASRTERDGATVDLTYGDATIAVRTTAKDGAVSETSLPLPADPVDNEASLQVQRGLPFAPEYGTAYADVIPGTGATAEIDVRVVGEEAITVPAGTFAAWHVKMEAGMVTQDAWYAKDAPHVLVRYENRAAGSTFALRSWRAAADGELHGSVDPTPPPRPRAGPVPINVAVLVATLAVQIPLMLVLPIVLGARLARRYGCGWRPWVAGAIAFVLSQVVHLPLNWALGLLGGGRGLGLLPVPLLAIAAGLSAGLCEEIARYLMLRYGLRRARSFREAVQFGVGHGGIEAMLLGVGAALALAVMLTLHWVPAATFGIVGDASTRVAEAADAYWSGSWDKPVTIGLERVFAMTAHVAMSVMVMRAIVRRRVGWLVAAIGAHTALDAFAVWGIRRIGVTGTEIGVGVFALGFAAAIWAMRDGAPATGAAPAKG